MARWLCTVCGYIYDESKGEPATKTPPNTLFKDLPEEWVCPVCGAPKDAFIQTDEDADSNSK